MSVKKDGSQHQTVTAGMVLKMEKMHEKKRGGFSDVSQSKAINHSDYNVQYYELITLNV